MSIHAPTLPTKSTWETPISASKEMSKEIAEVLAGAADTAVDAASGVVRSVRRRRSRGPVAAVAAALTWRRIVVGAMLIALVVAAGRRARGAADRGATESPAARGATQSAAEGPAAGADERNGELVDAGRPTPIAD